MIEGGDNLHDLEFQSPTDEFGTHFDPWSGQNFIGDMPPDFVGLNIGNPQSGYHYYWAINPKRDGGSNLIHLNQKYGFEMIGPNDPETAGIKHLGIPSLNTEGTLTFGDVVAVKTLQSHYDEVRRREKAENDGALEGVVHDFKSKDPNPRGKPTRYSTDDHGIQIEDF